MTTPAKPDYLRLSCVVQTYAWGKVGLHSEVARLKSSAEPESFIVDENEPYAELWMGTHIRGPSKISNPMELSGCLLSDWLKSNQWALGNASVQQYGGELPFLFKVLSINKALSIQAHPTKAHAQVLHETAPELYRDPNHKPELAIAISDFEGFCGFRPFGEIQGYLASVSELREMIGEEVCDQMMGVSDVGSSSSEEERKAVLKRVFTALMVCREEVVKEKLETLLKKIQEGTSKIAERESSLLVRLNNQFPGDIGCFCVFFLNFLSLRPGESLYLAPNEPHAYLYGEVVECMACSDNVVRAGLTVKHRDKETLCQMLTYNTKSPQENKFLPQPHPSVTGVEIYDPPTPEFAVARILIPMGSKEFLLPSITGPSILLILRGSLTISCGSSEEAVGKGMSIFLPATSPNVRLLPHSLEQETLLFQAFCNP